MNLKIIKKTDNQAIIEFLGEGHTILNLLRTELLVDERVLMATYDTKFPCHGQSRLPADHQWRRSHPDIERSHGTHHRPVPGVLRKVCPGCRLGRRRIGRNSAANGAYVSQRHILLPQSFFWLF